MITLEQLAALEKIWSHCSQKLLFLRASLKKLAVIERPGSGFSDTAIAKAREEAAFNQRIFRLSS